MKIPYNMLAIILGTRPEIIKRSPIIRSCQKKGVDFFVLNTGEHYSYNMERVFFEELNLPTPDFNLDVGTKNHAEQTGLIMTGVEKILAEKKPEVVLVQGDPNTVVGGTLAASKSYVRGNRSLPIRSYQEIWHPEKYFFTFKKPLLNLPPSICRFPITILFPALICFFLISLKIDIVVLGELSSTTRISSFNAFPLKIAFTYK